MLRGRAIAAIVCLALLTSACEITIINNMNTVRANRGMEALEYSGYMGGVAGITSSEACSTGTPTPSPDPLTRYRGETAVDVHELVGMATLDPATTSPAIRDANATLEIWRSWAVDDNAVLTDPRWDAMGVSQVACGNGDIAITLALRDDPSMPAAGTFVTPQHDVADLTEVTGIVYGQALAYDGTPVDLLLDLYLPPSDGTPRPTVVMVHGGGFVGGSRTSMATDAREYARRGFVAASIDYRLRPVSTPQDLVDAAVDATDDAQESVRWLESQAATYEIDTGRVAMIGSSAGGAIALGAAVLEDPSPGGPLAGYSPRIEAAVSTGAHITPGLGLVDITASDAPAMMFFYETDTFAGEPFSVAETTCNAFRNGGTTCDIIEQAGTGHTTAVGPQGAWWEPEIGPFLWYHLDLDALVSPPARPYWCDPTDLDLNDGHTDPYFAAYTELKGPLSDADCLAVSDLFAQAETFAAQYPTVADAEAGGFREAAVWSPGQGIHYLDDSRFNTFDPTRPNWLMYDGNEPTSMLTGMMFGTSSGMFPPAGFPGDNDHWHTHGDLCIANAPPLFILAEHATDEECAALGGTNTNTDSYWMVHVWLPEYMGHQMDDIFNFEHHMVAGAGGHTGH